MFKVTLVITLTHLWKTSSKLGLVVGLVKRDLWDLYEKKGKKKLGGFRMMS